ncbi:MAG: nucleoside triphosphate pyrophosphohydrolase [Sphingomonadales bacterium]|jgi:ATP diphosphatase|nr:nucleoside triphosphate pyrophosphohydrolase [Sphingomonadales bacterium]MBK9003648.1 nucleoside triphosphate pyrophosphohydrolase [Sphingomonadales bacterium]MBK9268822.1 nucleoside triphosphate pyrophosphohydrolase [Sphingomonadales bacterium]MBP6435260.1 nucleoside triphosphate pyrophosphohydrolase [Sphingorhabdus sp.]
MTPPSIEKLAEIMAKLRTPVTGCPWDLEQDFSTVVPYTIEEAYEVADAVERNDMAALKDELGDLLLQVVFHSRMAQEMDMFDLQDVIDGIADKMVRRHPHVFAEVDAATADAVVTNWEAIKAEERAGMNSDTSALAGVAQALPALLRAQKLQKRASRTGFDWDNVEDAIAKLDEEIGELRDAISDSERAEEAGDLLFAAVNVCRLAGIDAESALKAANAKFERRFRAMESIAGTDFEKLELVEQDALWQQVKAAERG